MTEFEQWLIKTLLTGLNAIFSLVEKKIEFTEYIKNFGSFYYENSLDGHEFSGDENRTLNKYSQSVSILREAQELLDNSFNEKEATDLSAYLDAGRVSHRETEKRLVELFVNSSGALILSSLKKL